MHIQISFREYYERQQELFEEKHLTHLSLKGNYDLPGEELIREGEVMFPKEFFEFSKLEHLEITWNPELEAFPEDLGKLKKLKVLELDNCENFQKFPASFGMLSALEEITVNNCKLSTFPTELSTLKKLRKIYIESENTPLKEFPLPLTQLENLEELFLQRNALTTLPSEIERLKNLVYLDVQENQIISFPEEVQALESLKVLDFRGNPMEEEEIQKLKELLPRHTFESHWRGGGYLKRE